MKDGALLRSSSLFIAYMGCLGWGSAYFYGWGTSFYYGFPWWIVGAGVDDVARSLFFAVIVIAIFLIGWGVGVVFFFAVKRKHSMQELNVFRLYFAVELLFVPAIIEFSILRQTVQVSLLLLSAAIALGVTIAIRFYGRFLSVSCFYDKPFIKKHFFEIVLVSFVAYFWLFSFLTGYYKPQFKKEYEMINYNDNLYYVLARYDNRLVLSTSFNAGNKRFVIYQSAQDKNLQVDIVRTRI
ncbi:hypothetical protein EYW98_00635 [Escherichia coli]|nr:hypothetical protein [Escherichia coli]EGO8375566.1 hypothetical protein [Escherichia coli]EHR8834889.1 hypothetical protein [Escherichia coli]MCH0695611.1 hypothetical protein [Escherichia coli]